EQASRPPDVVNDDTLNSLCKRYRQSQGYQRLSPATRKMYERYIDQISEKFGDAPLRAFEDRRIRSNILEWRDHIAQTTLRGADYAVSVLRSVLKFGNQIGEIGVNHAAGFDTLYKADRSDRIWLPEHVARMMAVASFEIRMALLFALHTGQRQGDLLTLNWNTFDGQALTFRQRKGNRGAGRHVYIPCTNALRLTLEQAPKRALTILTNSRGAPWTSDGFKTSWRKASIRAGIEGLTFHDLRGTAVTMLSEAGCTPQEVAAITGHSLNQVNGILDRYLSRTRPLAQAAIVKFENVLATKVTNKVTNGPGGPRSKATK
ncbi:MAG: tyrosine-type recombinase/integrase, partial [Pseudomonadota bacterium]